MARKREIFYTAVSFSHPAGHYCDDTVTIEYDKPEEITASKIREAVRDSCDSVFKGSDFVILMLYTVSDVEVVESAATPDRDWSMPTPEEIRDRFNEKHKCEDGKVFVWMDNDGDELLSIGKAYVDIGDVFISDARCLRPWVIFQSWITSNNKHRKKLYADLS